MWWAVAAPFFNQDDPETLRWLDDYAARPGRSFLKVSQGSPEGNWHKRRRRTTTLRGWSTQFQQARRCVDADGVITVFPPLAISVGLIQHLRRSAKPHIAWCFNLGGRPDGIRRALARLAARKITHLVVHSRAEIALVADYLDLPEHRVRFVPLQTVAFEDTFSTQEDDYVVAMGSANRDYATFLAAMRATGLPAKLIAAPRLLDGLEIPANVQVINNVTLAESRRIASRARLCIVPIEKETVASGQVTLVDAAAMARCIIATRSIGTVDYIEDGVNGALVPPRDAEAMARTIRALWDDDATRRSMQVAAHDRALSDWSDAATSAILDDMLREHERP